MTINISMRARCFPEAKGQLPQNCLQREGFVIMMVALGDPRPATEFVTHCYDLETTLLQKRVKPPTQPVHVFSVGSTESS